LSPQDGSFRYRILWETAAERPATHTSYFATKSLVMAYETLLKYPQGSRLELENPHGEWVCAERLLWPEELGHGPPAHAPTPLSLANLSVAIYARGWTFWVWHTSVPIAELDAHGVLETTSIANGDLMALVTPEGTALRTCHLAAGGGLITLHPLL
jgi:hypothetical protein